MVYDEVVDGQLVVASHQVDTLVNDSKAIEAVRETIENMEGKSAGVDKLTASDVKVEIKCLSGCEEAGEKQNKSSLVELRPGGLVQISGLQVLRELNGKAGRLLTHHEDVDGGSMAGRWEVLTEDKRTFAIKPENLKHLEVSAAPHAAALLGGGRTSPRRSEGTAAVTFEVDLHRENMTEDDALATAPTQNLTDSINANLKEDGVPAGESVEVVNRSVHHKLVPRGTPTAKSAAAGPEALPICPLLSLSLLTALMASQ